ncbi:MAG: flagellar basal-body MS-ring/collar protein FliF [Alphaproteobacteria bacterium]|nr:flagellar basal-body MS-ring/collar protein FliF [Alphaproteobacteria bacterium]
MNSFLATLQQLGPARLAVMGAIIIGLLMFFVFISLRITSPEMKLLYADLSTTDSGAIAAKLEETNIPYEISGDGARIFAPSNEIGRARMLLAEAGLPNGGSMGYKIFDEQSGFGTTNFVQNINQIRALEGELAKTIISLSSIKSARVHIVLPQRELFSRETRNSSASVFLGIRQGGSVERQEVLAVQSLVASAVPNLKASNVSIIDSNGNLLAKGGDEGSDIMSLKAEDLRRSYENRLTQKIEDQVSRVVGHGKVTAIVTAEMNFDQINMSEELYDPEGQVLRSSQTSQEDSTERESVADQVTVGNNLPGVGGDLLTDNQPSAQSNRVEEITNYEISKTIRSTQRNAGDIKKLSISVLIDGKYITQTIEDGGESEKIYQPRSQEEIDQISSLIRTAVGLDETRGDTLEVVNLQFAKVDTNEEFIDDSLILGFEKGQLLDAAEFVVVGIMIVLVVVLVLQPMVTKLMSMEPPRSAMDEILQAELLSPSTENPALAGPIGATMGDVNFDDDDDDDGSMVNISGIEGKVKASTVKKVEEIVNNYPEETVSVIRSWMAQES